MSGWSWKSSQEGSEECVYVSRTAVYSKMCCPQMRWLVSHLLMCSKTTATQTAIDKMSLRQQSIADLQIRAPMSGSCHKHTSVPIIMQCAYALQLLQCFKRVENIIQSCGGRDCNTGNFQHRLKAKVQRPCKVCQVYLQSPTAPRQS